MQKLTDLVAQLTAIEQRLTSLIEKQNRSTDAMSKLEDRLRTAEVEAAARGVKINGGERLFWVAVTSIAGAVIYFVTRGG